jgi:hypothetical protein
MMKNLSIFILVLIIACNSESKKSETAVLEKIIKSDSLKIKKDTANIPLLKLFFPNKSRTKQEIQKLITEIDALIKSAKLQTENVYEDDEPCAIIKFRNNGELIMIDMGCGDCSNVMGNERYYVKNNELICMQTHTIDYGYNPCWSEKNCKENGITKKYKKEHLRERNENYFIQDSIHMIFERKGNLNDTSYLSNDTLSAKMILSDAIKYLNKKESAIPPFHIQ